MATVSVLGRLLRITGDTAGEAGGALLADWPGPGAGEEVEGAWWQLERTGDLVDRTGVEGTFSWPGDGLEEWR